MKQRNKKNPTHRHLFPDFDFLLMRVELALNVLLLQGLDRGFNLLPCINVRLGHNDRHVGGKLTGDLER